MKRFILALLFSYLCLAAGQTKSPTWCEDTEELDIVLLVDTSTSINITNWPYVQEFLLNFGDQFTFGRKKDRLALVQYATGVHHQWPLGDKRAVKQTAFRKAVKELEFFGGATALGDGLKEVIEVELNHKSKRAKGGYRHNALTAVVVVTDGLPTKPDEDPFGYATFWAKKLKESLPYINLVTVTKRNETNGGELFEDISDAMIIFDEFPDLPALASNMSDLSKGCFTYRPTDAPTNGPSIAPSTDSPSTLIPTKTPSAVPSATPTDAPSETSDAPSAAPSTCQNPIYDIVFVLDESNSVSEKYALMLQFVFAVARLFTISPTDTRLAAILFSTRVWTPINFDNPGSIDIDEFETRMLDAEQKSGFTKTGAALNKALSKDYIFHPSKLPGGDRADITTLVILVTDGNPNRPVRTAVQEYVLASADLSSQENLMYLTVGIGDQADIDLMEQVSQFFMFVPGFEDLAGSQIGVGVIAGLCNADEVGAAQVTPFPTELPTKAPTEWDCSMHDSKRKCKKFADCYWNKAEKYCHSDPTEVPTEAPTDLYCGYKRRRFCKYLFYSCYARREWYRCIGNQNEKCTWYYGECHVKYK